MLQADAIVHKTAAAELTDLLDKYAYWMRMARVHFKDLDVWVGVFCFRM